jgi:hypothetical protein
VTLGWQAPATPCAISGYRIEAGSAPGLADLATLVHPSAASLVVQAPSGTYHVQGRALSRAVIGLATTS